MNLDGYTINRYGNGSQTPSETWPLSGSISSGDAISIGNGQLDSVYVNNTYWSLPVDPVFYSSCDYHCSAYIQLLLLQWRRYNYFRKKQETLLIFFGKVGEDQVLAGLTTQLWLYRRKWREVGLQDIIL